MQFQEARQLLERKGIQLGRELPRLTLDVQCKKPGWHESMLYELGWVQKDGEKFSVIVTNLPQFCGPGWREISGGKPLMIECQTADELVELLVNTLTPRMVEGVLLAE